MKKAVNPGLLVITNVSPHLHWQKSFANVAREQIRDHILSV